VKEQGQSWNGEYFRKMLKEDVIPFLEQSSKRQGRFDQITFLHDGALCEQMQRSNFSMTVNSTFFAGQVLSAGQEIHPS
jgi:hypothetical protein